MQAKKIVSLLLSALILVSSVPVAFAAGSPSSVRWNGHTYTRFDTPMTWNEARAYCASQGGYLATVTSEEENETLKNLVAGGQQAQYWLGATDEAHENRWAWVTGEPYVYEPADCAIDNAYGREHYMQMYRHSWGDATGLGHWNDSADDNHIDGEEAFFSTEHVGFIMETGDSAVPVEDNSRMPIVYVIGRTAIVTADGEPTITENTEYVTGVIKDNAELLSLAVVTNYWDPFFNALESAVSDRYASYRLNENGEVTNGSHARFTWNKDDLPQRMRGMYTFRYEYDARLDPCDIADDLNAYIEAIKEVTGYGKIHLVSRCLGCNIASAYLAEYGWESVETNLFFAGAQMGYDFVGELFAGKYDFDPDSIARYEEETYENEDGTEEGAELVKALISYMNVMGALGFGTDVAMRVFNNVKDRIAPQLLLDTYATSPGYWSMVNDENYEDAKAFIFGDEADTTYKKLVEKIDAYHYNVMNNEKTMLTRMHGDGVKIGVLCKYGFQTPPFIQSSGELSDNRIEVSAQSMGATAAKAGSMLSTEYILQLTNSGRARYLSPDKMIDGSTALFPDNTWYIKNLLHNPFPDCCNPLMQAICYAEKELTVWDDPAYPQYLLYQNDTISPLTVQNMHTEPQQQGRLFSFIRLVRALFDRIRQRLRGLFSFIHV